MKIYLFTLNGCEHCTELKQKLDNLSIIYHDVEITRNRKIWNLIVDKTNNDVVPSVFIQRDNDDNGLIYIPGRDFLEIDEIVEIIKKSLE